MMNRNVTSIFFSPSGTTAKVANQIASNISPTVQTIDLMKEKVTAEKRFSSEEIAIVAMPVFSGRIPDLCVDMLHKIKGNNAPVIAVVVYGNRAYDDALLELTNILKENGFKVVGAGAVIAQHSIFQDVAQGRPDNTDMEKIENFTKCCINRIASDDIDTISVPGNTPYREAKALPIIPAVSAKCTECGACIRICPVGAIPHDNPQMTDKEKCINCTACIHICPEDARSYSGVKMALGARSFAKKCAARLEPEFYYASKA